MAQCKCYSIYNDSTNSLPYVYTDCNTGEIFESFIDGNTTLYTCSLNFITSAAIVSIMANDGPCGGCNCNCVD